MGVVNCPRTIRPTCISSASRPNCLRTGVTARPLHPKCIRCYSRPPLRVSTASQQLQTRTHLHRYIQVQARRSRYDDDYVEYDDENSWSNQARRSTGLVPSFAGPVLLAANRLSEKVTDIVYDLVPSNIDRATVEIAVKAGLVLVAVGVIRSLLGIAFTIGTVLFGLYVATKIWGKQDAQDPNGARQTQQRRRQQRRRQDDDGLSDVWFESKPQRKQNNKTRDDDFW